LIHREEENMFRSRLRPLSFATLAVAAYLGAAAISTLSGTAAGSLALAGIVLAVGILLIRTARHPIRRAD
jgi:hypothetical protein